MLATEFLRCARRIAAYCLPHLMVFRDTTAERTAANDFLLYRRELLKTETWLSAQLPHGSLQNHIKMLPDKANICISQFKHRFNAH